MASKNTSNTIDTDDDATDAAAPTPITAAKAAAAPALTLSDQSDKLGAEILMAQMEVDTLQGTLSKIKESAGTKAILEKGRARLAGLQDKITKMEEQKASLDTRVANAAVFDPFLEACGTIAIPSDLSKVEFKLPASLDIASIEDRLAQAQLAVAVLGPIQAAAKQHLSDLDAAAWDSMPSLHVASSEDGSHATVKFATGRTRSSSSPSGTGAGRGNAATYRVIATPEDYVGEGAIGDTFGAGTENPDQTAYARKIEPRFDAFVEKRKASGGRVSPSNALKSLDWSIEKIS